MSTDYMYMWSSLCSINVIYLFIYILFISLFTGDFLSLCSPTGSNFEIV